jgi:UDP-glucose 4-epimerase
MAFITWQTRPISKLDLLRLVAEALRQQNRADAGRRDALPRIWFGEDVMFSGKVVAITGGTGSFGQHILKGFLATDVAMIRIFSRDEKKQEEMRSAFNNTKLKFYIGDVRAYDSIHQALKGADYVFHAAALKQVPSCEFYPLEAVRTNILGTENVMSAAVANGVEKVVVLSTDKAVYPINAMGQTKALMEKVMVAKSRSLSSTETLLCATRYGNVMVSRGSVIPLFVSQIKAGKPLTITDPNMTRFLMSLDDSVDLVLHAYGHGQQGDIFVQKAPAATIGDLVQALKEIFNADNPVHTVGTRHGEKLYESLVSREEMARVEDMQQYYRIPADNRDLNYAMYFTEGQKEVSTLDDYTSHNTQRLSVAQVKELLLKLDFIQRHLRGEGAAIAEI